MYFIHFREILGQNLLIWRYYDIADVAEWRHVERDDIHWSEIYPWKVV